MQRVTDTLYNILDSNTHEAITFTKVTKHHSGFSMSDDLCDGIIYRKKGSEYFRRNINGDVNVKWFGAKGNAKVVFDAAITEGTAIVTSATANFTLDMVGEMFMIRGAGAAGTPLVSIISSVESSTQITIASNASVSVSGQEITYGGIDETGFFQAAIDYLIATNGGALYVPVGRYWINGTLYVNPAIQIPISILGVAKMHKDTGRGSRTCGTVILRSEPGDIIRVNLNEDGEGVITYPGQYTGFAINNIGFVSKSDVSGINCIVPHRTRGVYRNLNACRLDYLIKQSDLNGGHENYCDQSYYENLKISESLYSGVLLQRFDSSIINGFYFEGPQPTAKYALEAENGTNLQLNGVVHWSPSGGHATITDGAFIRLKTAWNCKLNNLHLERVYYESAISLRNCRAITIDDLHTRYLTNDTLRIHTCTGVFLKKLNAYDVKQTNTYDINIVSGASSNNEIYWEDVQLYAYPDVYTSRVITTNGLEYRGSTDRYSKRNLKNDFHRATDAAYTLELDDLNSSIFLPTITANRTLIIPLASAVGAGKSITIYNRNTGPFAWSLSQPYNKPDGSGSLVINSQSVMKIETDDNANWRELYINNLKSNGTLITSGNGVLTSFSVPHGLGATPVRFGVIPTGAAAGNISYLTADSSSITWFYTTAPVVGVNNLTYRWWAEK